MIADPKPKKRLRDSDASKRKLALEPMCRTGCGQRAVDAHHVLLRSQSGDDVEDNLIPLCRQHHYDYHNANIGLRLTLDERLYVLTKLGQGAGTAYLERRRYEQ